MDKNRLKRISAGFLASVLITGTLTACTPTENTSLGDTLSEYTLVEAAPTGDTLVGDTEETGNRPTVQQANEVDITPKNEKEQSVSLADEILLDMTLDEKIGQMMLVNFRSWKSAEMEEAEDLTVMNDEIAQIIGDYHIGNMILFGENTKTTEQTIRLTDALQQAAMKSDDLPLMIGIDQEGGIITRLGQGTCMPGNMAVGATGNTEYAYDTGKVIGEELKVLGISATFAPDADVNNNPENPIIHLRSFGDDANQVAEYVVRMQDGLNDAGISACAKHFPGHGNTATDTHTGLAIVDQSKEEWEQCEQLPFQAAADNQVDIIMTAHIQYPGLDHTQTISKEDGSQIYLPATLSGEIVTGILKGEMNYSGVVSTDAMDMQAITSHFGETEAILMAINAGVDMLCNPTSLKCSEDAIKLKNIYDEIKKAVTSGTISEDRIDDAVLRILKMKERRGILEIQKDLKQSGAADKDAVNHEAVLNKRMKQAETIIGSQAHREKEREIAEAAVTLYNQNDVKTVSPKVGETLLFIMPDEDTCNSIKFAVSRLVMEKTIPEIRTEYYIYKEAQKLDLECEKKLETADYILVGSKMSASVMKQPDHWQIAFPQQLCAYIKAQDICEKTAILSLALPYDAANYPDEQVYIAYGYQTMSREDAESGVITGKYGPNIPAVVGAALGAFSPKGKLPVKIGSMR